MPFEPEYPGVYIDEVSTRDSAIVRSPTSTAAIVGGLENGPVDQPVEVGSVADFEAVFGSVDPRARVGPAVAQFFAAGGQRAWVVRTTHGGTSAQAELTGKLNAATKEPTPALRLSAAHPGVNGNHLRITVDLGTNDPQNGFDLRAVPHRLSGGSWIEEPAHTASCPRPEDQEHGFVARL